jgi:hypothetical protein
MKVIRGVGPVYVTLDGNLDPVRVDNIDNIKAYIKKALETDSGFPAEVVPLVYNMLTADLTPETAADLLRQNGQRGGYLNIPLTIGQPAAIRGAPVFLLGGAFRVDGTVTLTKWEEGKTAHLTLVLTPTQEDMRAIIRGVSKKLLRGTTIELSPKDTEAENKAMADILDEIAAETDIKMSMTCDTDLSLVNYIETHMVCLSSTQTTMDRGKMRPTDPSGEKPPVTTRAQTTRHAVDTVMVK